jgi:hypothetical protein
VPRRTTARQRTLSERLAAFLRSLPDHPLLDRLVRGRVWIPLLGVMLVGIVAMQVELLKLNADTGRSIELIGSLQGRNDILRAQVASASDPSRIEHLASRMGMTMPGPESITFLKARSASARRALAAIRVPNLAAFEAALPASSAAGALPTASTSPTSAPASTKAPSHTTNTTPATQANTTPAPTGAQANTIPTGGQTNTTTTPSAPAGPAATGTSSSTGAPTSTASAPPATVP